MSLLDKTKLCIDVSHAELWDYDPVQSLTDFWDQLNYVHLQDYTSCTVREPGRYNPEWVSVGEGECLDFAGVLNTLAERGFDRWVTVVQASRPTRARIQSARRRGVRGCASICGVGVLIMTPR